MHGQDVNRGVILPSGAGEAQRRSSGTLEATLQCQDGPCATMHVARKDPLVSWSGPAPAVERYICRGDADGGQAEVANAGT